jgi:glycosyltransferase involved in cell wall biosynthesis
MSMTEDPKISIITITYNSAAHIEEALLSVIRQDYPRLEYIIIDGGSTDGTLDILSRYSDHIAVLVSEPDGGISDAFNKGIRRATGQVVGIINSDDLLAPGALRRVAEVYDPAVDLYRGDCLILNPETDFTYRDLPTLRWPAIPLKMRVCHPSTFVSAESYRRLGGYDTALRYMMDIDLLRRYDAQGARVLYVPHVLATFRLGGVSQTDLPGRRRELRYILRKNGSTRLQVLIFDLYYCGRQVVKRLVTLFGDDKRFLFTKKL